MITIDLHLHTNASHAKNSVAEMADSARQHGLQVFGFSEHSPRPVGYSYPQDYREKLTVAFPEYVREVLELRAASHQPQVSPSKQQTVLPNEQTERVPKPQVLLGMELDWLPNERAFMEKAVRAYPFDYVIGGIHFLDQWGFDFTAQDWENFDHDHLAALYSRYFDELRNMAQARLAIAESQKEDLLADHQDRLVDIAAHPDIIKLFTIADFHRWLDSPTNLAKIEKALIAIRDAGMAMEISSAGLRKPCEEIYPNPAIMCLAANLSVPISFGSDAHSVKDVAYAFDHLESYARSFGYTESCYFVNRKAQKRKF